MKIFWKPVSKSNCFSLQLFDIGTIYFMRIVPFRRRHARGYQQIFIMMISGLLNAKVLKLKLNDPYP